MNNLMLSDCRCVNGCHMCFRRSERARVALQSSSRSSTTASSGASLNGTLPYLSTLLHPSDIYPVPHHVLTITGDKGTALSAAATRSSLPFIPCIYLEQSTKSVIPSLCRFAHGADSLLDLACGRGGDLHKWVSAQVGGDR